MNQRKRVLICGIEQESNCFNPLPMTMASFNRVGAETSGYQNAKGVREYLQAMDVECVYGLHMRSAGSGGPLDPQVVDHFLKDTLAVIEQAGRLDGVLLLLHGATMAQDCDDVCGYVCETVRKAVGENVILSGSFDLHGNITERIAKNLDYICGYWEYPHIDQRQTGERAARMLYERLCGTPLRCARASIPSLAPANAYTTTKGALLALREKAQVMVASGQIADYTVFQAQPWLDHPEVASAVIVIAADEQTAVDAANELIKDNFNCREELQGEPLLTVDEVVERALANESGKPVILVDSADSIGAGSVGDSASVLEALLPYADRLRGATSVTDPAAVERAFALGVGATAEFTLGATIAPQLSHPVTVTATVRSLHTGNFFGRGPILKNSELKPGKVAVLEVGRLLIRVGLKDIGAPDVNFYNSFGITVENRQLVAVKACTSFRASYEPIAGEICNANTAGAACPVLRDLPYKRLPKLTYPFEEIIEKDISFAKCYR